LCLIVIGGTQPAWAQYILPEDTVQKPAETVPKPEDTIPKPEGDSLAQPPPAPNPDSAQRGESTSEDSLVVRAPQISEKEWVETAQKWVKRLLFRGELDSKVIGAYAQYQLTSWSEAGGSFGPIHARVTVAYLGSTRWQDKNAEWLQTVFQTLEGEPMLVEFDMTVPTGVMVHEVYQAYYRVNRGVIRSISIGAAPSEVDFDSGDRPAAEGTEEVKLYSGTYQTEKFRGSGEGGLEVVIYRSASAPPLGVVRLGYGDEGLTYTGGGNDAVARFIPPGGK
jgi:hypothetical protein